jgi:hypothetical protein
MCVCMCVQDLITKLLCQCPRSRLSATQALRHPWLNPQHVSTLPTPHSMQRSKAALDPSALFVCVCQAVVVSAVGVRMGFHPRRKLRATIRSVRQLEHDRRGGGLVFVVMR